MAITTSVDSISAQKDVDDPTLAITPVSGDTMMIVSVYIDDTSEGSFTSISDDNGGTYTAIPLSNLTSGNQNMRLFSNPNPATGATVITVVTTASCDTIIQATTFQGTLTTSFHGTVAGGILSGTFYSDNPTLSFSNSILISIWSGNTNSTVTYGTDQLVRNYAVNAGAEKFAGGMSSEIVTSTASNPQTGTLSKSETYLPLTIEMYAETTGFAHSQGCVIG